MTKPKNILIAVTVVTAVLAAVRCSAWLGRLDMANKCSNSVGENVAAGLRWCASNLYRIQACEVVVQATERGTVGKVAANTRGAAAKLCCALGEICSGNILWTGTLNALLPLQKKRLVIGQPGIAGYLNCVLPSLALASGSEAVSKPTQHNAEGKRQDGRKLLHQCVQLILLFVGLFIGFNGREWWITRNRPNDPSSATRGQPEEKLP